MIVTLVFKENANFFAENGEKLLKIVIITSTPGADSVNQFWPEFRVICIPR
jgi:hypothetical protein